MLCALLSLACRDEEPYEGVFDEPIAVAVLQPERGGPFTEPIGFVASGHGGQLPVLALKQGRFLTDDPTVSFLRGQTLATGAGRILSSVAVWAPAVDQVSVFAGDRSVGTLLRVPYVIGLEDDGSPREGWMCDAERYVCDGTEIFEGPRRTEPTCANDGEPCSDADRLLDNVELKEGYTSTERWTLTWLDEGTWEVSGSRSGRQEQLARVGERFVATRRAVAFTVARAGVAGDVIEFATDNGVVEIDVGGIPQSLAMSPDQSRLAMVVHDRDLDAPVLRWLDPETSAVTGTVPLPADARPGRLAWAEEEPVLLVADHGRAALWEVPLPSDASAPLPIEHPLPWPVLDAAPLYSEEWGRLVYVVPFGTNEVWILDLDEDVLLDVNTAAPGVQGMHLEAPVLGVEALPLEHQWRRQNDFGVRESGRSVAVATHEGRVVFMEEGTGCLVDDELGPRTEASTDLRWGDFATNFDALTGTGPFLQQNGQNTRHVVVNPCAGIARREQWTLAFDSNQSAWAVDGAVTGEQVGLAREDERYVSDQGEVSFLVVAGATPSREGWRMQFSVLEGALQANGDNDRDGIPEIALEVPGDPVFFHYRVGLARFGGPADQRASRGEPPAWMQVDDRAFVLVPSSASNLVGRANPQEAALEVSWN